jgi:hypothetical protein
MDADAAVAEPMLPAKARSAKPSSSTAMWSHALIAKLQLQREQRNC